MERTRSAPEMLAVASAWARAATATSGWTPGVQLWARRGSSEVDLALGTSPFIGPMRRSVLHDAGPAVDALLALAILAAAERVDRQLDEPVPLPVDPHGRTIGDVLCARGGTAAADGDAPVRVLEWLAGVDAVAAVSALVAGPLGIDDELWLSVPTDELPAMRARCGAMVRRMPTGDVALAAPLRAAALCAPHDGRSRWTTARALGRVFSAWTRLSVGRPDARLLLPTPCYVRAAWKHASHLVALPASSGAPTWRGPGLVRNVGGCLSFALPPSAFGRVGAAAGSLAVCDPDLDLTAVIVTNAVCDRWDDRRARFDELLAAMAAMQTTADRGNDRAVRSDRA